MKATWLYRIAAILLLLFAAGHTFGFLNFKAPTAEGQAVFESMNAVHFQVKHGTYSYGGWYRGFGLFVSVYLLFSAFLAWHLGGLARKLPQAIGGLGWAFLVTQVVSLVLSLMYFSAIPAAFSAVVAICLGWAVSAGPAAHAKSV